MKSSAKALWLRECGYDPEQIYEDALTMALRLYGEDPKTFSPECAEVMDRWAKIVERKIKEGAGMNDNGLYDCRNELQEIIDSLMR